MGLRMKKAQLEDTIKRLTKENVELKTSGRQAIDAGEKIIERLTKERDEATNLATVLKQTLDDVSEQYNGLGRRHDALSAELAKAREALSAIRDLPETKPTLAARHYWHQAQTIARAALPATPEPKS